MEEFIDLWSGKYILLHPDGWPVGVANSHPRNRVPFHANSPHEVHFWSSIEEAKAFSQECGNIFTVHRVDRLAILKDRYTY